MSKKQLILDHGERVYELPESTDLDELAAQLEDAMAKETSVSVGVCMQRAELPLVLNGKLLRGFVLDHRERPKNGLRSVDLSPEQIRSIWDGTAYRPAGRS